MTDHIVNTVITIDLKEYARLQAIEQAAQEVLKTLSDDEVKDNMVLCGAGYASGKIAFAERKLAALLEGDK